ncbi:DinB family protein [Aggregatimonas sangjinii]|uniref:DinB family protein n=1 Tax=Aggregatimonas sangjinii TaxID=2583587 RepID=A0A5B7SRW7_9FLAO|nr:DinB family protein [Aggregatimonas sangjinii]QCX01297.1 DinB family protein [Aggregatimonas sangjinii]
MKSELKIIIENLVECFDGEPWYGISVMEKLNAVPWQKVNEKRYGAKSIAVLVQHIINWRIFCLRKLQGDLDYDLIIDGPTDWSDVHIASEGEWEALKSTLVETQTEILAMLRKTDDSLLTEQVPGKKYTFNVILTSIAQHDIYHLGQIAMLNSKEGS